MNGFTELLDTKVIYANGPYQRVRRWWRGIHPELGTIHRGFTGWETVQEVDVIKPSYTFFVNDAPCE